MHRSNAPACKGAKGAKALFAASILALATAGYSGSAAVGGSKTASTAGASASSTQAADYYYEAVFLANDEA